MQHKAVVFVLMFTCLENIIMRQHAYAYTYDRMKLVLPIVIIGCDFLYFLLRDLQGKKLLVLKCFVSILMVIYALGSFWIYRINPWQPYMEEAPQRTSNRLLLEELKSTDEWRSGSVLLGTNLSVRGYINLLFHRSVVECSNVESLVCETLKRNNRYAIFVKCQWDDGNLYKINYIEIFDARTGERIKQIRPRK